MTLCAIPRYYCFGSIYTELSLSINKFIAQCYIVISEGNFLLLFTEFLFYSRQFTGQKDMSKWF